jgi:DNA-directed RNA polymerase specialized sigma24 family protein
MQERIDAEARGRELYAALADLPDGERSVFELTALDGLTPGEAAAALGARSWWTTRTLARRRCERRGAPASRSRPVELEPRPPPSRSSRRAVT